MSIEVVPSTNEPIRLSLSDSVSGWLTGQTVRASVVNVSAGTVWNWTAVAFQSFAAAGANQWQALAEVDATNEPGVYQGATAFPVPAGSGTYEVRVERNPGAGFEALATETMRASLAPLIGALPTAVAIAAAVWAVTDGTMTKGAALDLLRRRVTNKRVLSALGVLSFYADDGTTVERTSTVRDVAGVAVVPASGDASQASAEA